MMASKSGVRGGYRIRNIELTFCAHPQNVERFDHPSELPRASRNGAVDVSTICAVRDASVLPADTDGPNVVGGLETGEPQEVVKAVCGASAGAVTALLASFTVAVGIAVAALYRTWDARFGPIDDHEPLRWMGSDGSLGVDEWWSTFWSTEVGDWGSGGRFRPAYYAVRVTQTVLFGDSPRLWYAFAAALFIVGCVLIGCSIAIWAVVAAAPRTPRAQMLVCGCAAGAGTFMACGLFAWTGMVGRLGPSEPLGIVGTGVALLALTLRVVCRNTAWWWPALAGLTVAVFSKESFASLAVILPTVGWYSYVHLGRHKTDVVAGIAALVPPIVLAAVLVPALARNDGDVYGRGVGFDRFSNALDTLFDPGMRHWTLSTCVAVVAWLVAARTTVKSTAPRCLFLALVLWPTAAVVLDAFLYAGNYNSARYRTMFDLAIMLQFVAAVCLLLASARRSTRWDNPVALVCLAVAAVVTLGLVGRAVANVRATEAIATANAEASVGYQRALDEFMSVADETETAPIAVVVSRGIDFEAGIATLNEVWRRSGGSHPLYLVLDQVSLGPPTVLAELKSLSEKGDENWHIRPVAEISGARDLPCIAINPSRRQPPVLCDPSLTYALGVAPM
jgi:hypothetical protein